MSNGNKFIPTKEELLRRCRVYKGELECPNNANFILWEAEKMYVDEYSKESSQVVEEALKNLHRFNLAWVGDGDGFPLEVIALLFAIFDHGGYNPTDINANYFPAYYEREIKKNGGL